MDKPNTSYPSVIKDILPVIQQMIIDEYGYWSANTLDKLKQLCENYDRKMDHWLTAADTEVVLSVNTARKWEKRYDALMLEYKKVQEAAITPKPSVDTADSKMYEPLTTTYRQLHDKMPKSPFTVNVDLHPLQNIKF